MYELPNHLFPFYMKDVLVPDTTHYSVDTKVNFDTLVHGIILKLLKRKWI